MEGKAAEGTFMQIVDGRFRDDRWTADGRWDLAQFKDSKGEVDWDAVSPRAGRGAACQPVHRVQLDHADAAQPPAARSHSRPHSG